MPAILPTPPPRPRPGTQDRGAQTITIAHASKCLRSWESSQPVSPRRQGSRDGERGSEPLSHTRRRTNEEAVEAAGRGQPTTAPVGRSGGQEADARSGSEGTTLPTALP